ncbi:hypothetical protein [Streptomyces roseolus]|uniref:hypothetical protein n=1 Tax=Streptomyces roseolus TaxID=67358 RepID=UPI0037A113FF
MQLTIDHDVTSGYLPDYALTLTISPSSDSAHLAWTPDGLEEPQTFEIRLGRHPLTTRSLTEMRRTFEEFPERDVIRGAVWEYDHERSLWRWAAGPWWQAIAALEARLWPVVDSGF